MAPSMNQFCCMGPTLALLAIITAPITLGILLINFLQTLSYTPSIPHVSAPIAHVPQQEGPCASWDATQAIVSDLQ